MKELYIKSLEINNISKNINNSYIDNLSIIKNFKCLNFKKPVTFLLVKMVWESLLLLKV